MSGRVLTDTRLFSVISLPHAEHVTIRATQRLADHHHSITEHAKATHPPLAVLFSQIFGFEMRRLKNLTRVHEIEIPLRQCRGTLVRVAGDCHEVSVTTSTAID